MSLLYTNWKAFNASKRQWDKRHLKTLSVQESIQRFSELYEFSQRLPRWGNLEKLHQSDLQHLIRWKQKLNRLQR